MARIVYSALVTEIKGSIGGTTFQSNAYGFTIKNKASIKRPKTVYQNRSKLYMAAATQAWNTIGASARSQWNAWAAANPQYAKNNPSSILSGFAVFTKWHFNQFLGEGDITDTNTAPSYTIVPKDSPSFVLQWDAPNLNLIHSWATGGGNLKVNLFISQPFQASVNFVGSRVRLLGQIVNTDATENIYNEYVALYGERPEVGEKVFVECVQRNTNNGLVYARQTFEVVVESA